MTGLTYRPKLRGGELEYVGRLADVGTRRVEVVQFDAWYEVAGRVWPGGAS